jgi:hypothetical protein
MTMRTKVGVRRVVSRSCFKPVMVCREYFGLFLVDYLTLNKYGQLARFMFYRDTRKRRFVRHPF